MFTTSHSVMGILPPSSLPFQIGMINKEREQMDLIVILTLRQL